MRAPLLTATSAAAHGRCPATPTVTDTATPCCPRRGRTSPGRRDPAPWSCVLYGAKSGLSASRRSVITQNAAGVPGTAETEDRFDAATATADLNRDGYADLVVGAPNEDTTRGRDAGTVSVLWGGKNGLTSGTDLPATSTRTADRSSSSAPRSSTPPPERTGFSRAAAAGRPPGAAG
ncbi:hypothetical protein ABZ178_27735 [Streptomyces massasporeus]|uniref:FG-GAP repeat protein n=1 Tax=Streptomyces massasporeus TaxID=67324 RepID=UPI0033BBDBB7